MVRVPTSWLPSLAAPSNRQGGTVAARPINATPVTAYTSTVTVDLGNDGVAPTVLFNSSGDAWAFCGPSGWGESWALDQAFISTSIGALDPSTCTVYAGPYMQPFSPVQQYAVAPALLGGANQLGMGGVAIATGWFITAYWTGGTSGASAQLRLSGTKTARRT